MKRPRRDIRKPRNPCIRDNSFSKTVRPTSDGLFLFNTKNGSLLMQKYKMARWRRILRRSAFRRRQIRSVRYLRHSRSRAARICSAVILSIAWLVLPLLPGCGSEPTKPAAMQSGSPPTIEPPTAKPSSPDSPPPVPAAGTNPGRVIRFRGVDNEYRGSTHVLPDGKVAHQKEQHD